MVVRFIVVLNSANLICRGTDISKYSRESLELRDNESRLYLQTLLFPSKATIFPAVTCLDKYITFVPLTNGRSESYGSSVAVILEFSREVSNLWTVRRVR